MDNSLEIKGEVFLPGTEPYDSARAVWNAMIDRRPALIARCRDLDDVARAIRHARARRLSVAVRGGGHNVAGLGTCDGGLLIDLSAMRTVELGDGCVHVQGGAVWADVDRVTQRAGRAVPSGIISSTGVGGLTLGGGIGWLARRYGLTADNLLGAELVGADGSVRRASDQEDAELLWALRGGGGNFGVVTEFTFRTHRAGPEVLFGPTIYAHRDAVRVLGVYREFARSAPREATVWVDLLSAPPLPFLSPVVVGTPVVSVIQCYTGDPEQGKRVLAPLRSAAPVLGDAVRVRPYVEAQTLFDATYGPGMRNYWKAHNLEALSDSVIQILAEAAGRLPTPESDIMIHQLGGAIDDPPEGATAYPHRGTAFALTPGARWSDAADDARSVAWVRATYDSLVPHALGTAYSNFIGEATGSEQAAYSKHLGRLQTLKRRYDPDNLFRTNQNIAP